MYSKKLEEDCKCLVRRRAGIERRIDRQINEGVESYRKRYAKQRKRGDRPLTILAEGDSWFRYGAGFAIIYYLERLLDTEILNLAKPGDEVRSMLTGTQLKRLRRELKRGPSRNTKYDFLLFSGGGNDLVGEDTFYKWLNDYRKGMQAGDIINYRTLGCALEFIEVGYRELLLARRENSPNTHVLLHGYDFAWPNGEGVCWLGPWLQPGLKQRKVPANMRREVVRLFLLQFDALLQRIADSERDVYVVPTQGTLQQESQWANELHPKNGAFKLMARKFADLINAIEPRVSP